MKASYLHAAAEPEQQQEQQQSDLVRSLPKVRQAAPPPEAVAVQHSSSYLYRQRRQEVMSGYDQCHVSALRCCILNAHAFLPPCCASLGIDCSPWQIATRLDLSPSAAQLGEDPDTQPRSYTTPERSWHEDAEDVNAQARQGFANAAKVRWWRLMCRLNCSLLHAGRDTTHAIDLSPHV